MLTLPPALAALGRWDQWLPVQLVPSRKHPGKMDKLPLSPTDLQPSDAHSPIHWRSFSQVAELIAALRDPNYMPGFVLTRETGIGVMDLDNCLTVDGEWTPIAVEIMTRLNGAAVELSQSGRGLHIFGQGVFAEHACKNKEHGLEFYTEGRFIAVTCNVLAGDARTDITKPMRSIINDYFPPNDITAAENWNEKPVPDWNGPVDDDELIDKMMRSQSAQVFTGKASIADLWTNNETALANTYPSLNDVDPYDRSVVDMALASHLCWWTGNDHARVERLMRRSGLVRPKWTQHKSYLRDTILRATSERVMTARAPVVEPEPQATVGHQFIASHQIEDHFKGCVYVADKHRIFTPDGELLKPEAFKAMYGGMEFALDALNTRVTDDAFKAFTLNQAIKFPKAASTAFRPLMPPGKILIEEQRPLINTYVPINVRRREGNPQFLIDHVKFIYPDEWRLVLAYCMALAQNPGVKFQWWLLLQGAEGNGKSFICEALARAVGLRYSHWVNANDLDNKFNAWVPHTLLAIIEDVVMDRTIMEIIKTLVTNTHIEVQGKGSDQVTGDNCVNALLTSNHKEAIPITFDTRRFALAFAAQQTREDVMRDFGPNYFRDLYRIANNEGGWEIGANYLLEETPDPQYNPAGDCNVAPHTSATEEAIALSRGTIEQMIVNAVEEERPGFKGGWMSSAAIDALLIRHPSYQKISHSKRRAMIQSLGYDWHPSLPNGRATTVINAEQARPKIYIRNDHIHKQLTDPSTVMEYYIRSQGYEKIEVQQNG